MCSGSVIGFVPLDQGLKLLSPRLHARVIRHVPHHHVGGEDVTGGRVLPTGSVDGNTRLLGGKHPRILCRDLEVLDEAGIVENLEEELGWELPVTCLGRLLPAGNQVPYHYHVKRESVIIAISGEAIEIVEGKEYPFKAGSVCYIAAGEKHTTVNRSDRDFRYLEFFTCPPVSADFIEVK